jgi:MipA family protein
MRVIPLEQDGDPRGCVFELEARIDLQDAIRHEQGVQMRQVAVTGTAIAGQCQSGHQDGAEWRQTPAEPTMHRNPLTKSDSAKGCAARLAGLSRSLRELVKNCLATTPVHFSTTSPGGSAILRLSMSGNLLKIAALCVVSSLAHAQANDPNAAGAAATPSVPAPPPRERSWRLGAAFGYGERTNPLIQSDDIPVIVDLDIAWFGKRWFFDNGDVGFTLFDRQKSTTSLVARLNSDRVFFGKTNTRYVNFTYLGAGEIAPLTPSPGVPAVTPQPIEVKPPDRDYAIELGVESLIDGDWGAATLRAFHDVSGTHGGYELAAHYSRRWTHGRLSFAPTVGIAYKSAQLNDYYWGVHANEANSALPEYHAGGGFAFEGGLVTNYYLSRNLRIAFSVNYERLVHDVAESPLSEDDYVLAYFSGLAWTF